MMMRVADSIAVYKSMVYFYFTLLLSALHLQLLNIRLSYGS